ncbi:hypothetical protein M231_04349 [Tremella mesenterica]|uniref:PX domain-containing protein n=1 Tax=Tremella mesenterica TaxID=5217 RepID=A0A4Q1BL82_TREME|nr:hypothetical protein M231_04349 [Tremella mesenterica]
MDPLSPANINAGWASSPTSPVRPLDAGPSLMTPTSQGYSSSTQSPAREPKVFGAPGMGLVSPPGATEEQGGKVKPFLRVRIGGLERNRKDLLIRFDASVGISTSTLWPPHNSLNCLEISRLVADAKYQTNLPNFRATLYRNMQRSYVEFQRFAEQAQLTSPQTIIPALPLPTTSALTDEEVVDDRLVRLSIQRWFTRICEDVVLMKDDELRNFIESDFGYQPAPPPTSRRPMSSASAVPNVLSAALSKVVRRGPLDEDDELQSARVALEKLEERWGSAAAAVGNMGRARRSMALATAEMGGKLISLSTVESDQSLANAERKIGRGYEQLSGVTGAQAASENVVLSDSLGYQALNARAAKDALIQRTAILEDSQSAVKAAINKRRNVERLKGSSNINPIKVDDAISEMEEANALESQLTSRLNSISTNLHLALRTHSRQTHEDVALFLLENARLTVNFEKQILKELESLRSDVSRIGTTLLASAPQNTLSTSVSAPQMGSYDPISPPQGLPGQSGLSGIAGIPSKPLPNAPSMTTSKSYQSGFGSGGGSKSMFLPPPGNIPDRPNSTGPTNDRDPLGQMSQSVILPPGHQVNRTQTLGRVGAKRLDERKAAKLLANGF